MIMISQMHRATVEAYQRFSGQYDHDTQDFWNKFPRDLFAVFAEELSGPVVLNIGCGPGRDALLLRESGVNTICLDAAPSMAQRTLHLGFPSVIMDFEELGIRKGSLDGVWAYTALLHTERRKFMGILRAIRELLIPNGVLGLGMIEGEEDKLVERPSMPEVFRHFSYYQEEELVAYLNAARFEVVIRGSYQPNKSRYLHMICKAV